MNFRTCASCGGMTTGEHARYCKTCRAAALTARGGRTRRDIRGQRAQPPPGEDQLALFVEKPIRGEELGVIAWGWSYAIPLTDRMSNPTGKERVGIIKNEGTKRVFLGPNGEKYV